MNTTNFFHSFVDFYFEEGAWSWRGALTIRAPSNVVFTLLISTAGCGNEKTTLGRRRNQIQLWPRVGDQLQVVARPNRSFDFVRSPVQTPSTPAFEPVRRFRIRNHDYDTETRTARPLRTADQTKKHKRKPDPLKRPGTELLLYLISNPVRSRPSPNNPAPNADSR